jgi:hypothetical protein
MTDPLNYHSEQSEESFLMPVNDLAIQSEPQQKGFVANIISNDMTTNAAQNYETRTSRNALRAIGQ